MNLSELLSTAIQRMDRARDILTDGKPTSECNWGLLDTSDLKRGMEDKLDPQNSSTQIFPKIPTIAMLNIIAMCTTFDLSVLEIFACLPETVQKEQL